MNRQYILVDYENVQPSSLGALKPGDVDIRVFLGAHQTRLDVELVKALHRFGAHGDYIQITGSGKDALDFHIAYYIGRLSAEHPGASFVIVSRDTGFDPLVKHLASRGISCKRVATIPGVSVTLPTTPPAPAAAKAAKKATKKATAKVAKPAVPPRLSEVVDRLAGLKHARPGTVKALGSTLKSFAPPIVDAERDAIVAALQRDGVLKVEGTKVVYPNPVPHPKKKTAA